jgi:putative PIN family toxin of toxin-antitoxin system
MVRRKLRTSVVLDTNVFVRAFKARSNRNANQQVVRLWLVRKWLQLVVCHELIAEYLGIFADVLGMDDDIIHNWKLRFESDERTTLINPGARPAMSRDPDDDLLLATAIGGRAEFLITNDRDLLEVPDLKRRTLSFEILTPQQFLTAIGC